MVDSEDIKNSLKCAKVANRKRGQHHEKACNKAFNRKSQLKLTFMINMIYKINSSIKD